MLIIAVLANHSAFSSAAVSICCALLLPFPLLQGNYLSLQQNLPHCLSLLRDDSFYNGLRKCGGACMILTMIGFSTGGLCTRFARSTFEKIRV